MTISPEKAELITLETAFKNAWDAQACPIVMGDDPFKAPKTGPWVRFMVQHGTPDRADLGGSSTRTEHPGQIVVQCYIPTSGDVSPHWQVADFTQAVRDIFEDKEFVTGSNGHIICYTTGDKRLRQEASWKRYNITTNFVRYEVGSL